MSNNEYILELANNRAIFGLAAALFLIFAIIILTFVLMDKIKAYVEMSRKKKAYEDASVKNLNYSKLNDKRKSRVLRKIVAPDAIDPAPNGYMIIEDGGKTVYVRTFTITSLPKNTTFANTFSGLFDFPGCTSSVIIEPVSEAVMSKKLDRQATVLSAEYQAAAGDVNRTRKIEAQFKDAYRWAEEIEDGEQKFFDVGFVFTLFADTLQALNKTCDMFRSQALLKNVIVSGCYAVQAEAFQKNAPFNNEINIESRFIKTDAVHFFKMDKYSLSTVFNYTVSSFSHKEGIFLGRDMDTYTPFFFDIFDESHDGYTLCIAGKTGSGKSATIKELVVRSVPYGYFYVCIDSQQRKGSNEGEFASVAQAVNGVNFKIAQKSKNIMNPFEIGETTRTEKDSLSTMREVRTLELNEKIGMVVHTLSTMIQGAKEYDTLDLMVPVNRILTDAVAAIYQEFGIYEGEPESLYEIGTITYEGQITTGRVKKKLPTITDFYKKILIDSRANDNETLSKAYNLIEMGLKDFVRELYYTSDTLTFLSREEVSRLRFKDTDGIFKIYVNEEGKEEDVITIKGIRPYYDGQSTIDIGADCPFANIDISLLPENERNLARQIAFDFVNESFIKKNSEDIRSAKKLVAIFDECHENFGLDYARKTLENVVRTARKRHVALILSSQTLKEYDNYKETKAILTQATTRFIFKQDVADRDYLRDTIGLTEAQVERIVNRIGVNEKTMDEEQKNKHRGEVCIQDNKNVIFCKIDYLKKTEALVVATDAETIEKVFKRKSNTIAS